MNLGGQELRILDQVQWLQAHGHAAWLLTRPEAAIYKEALRRRLPVHPVPFRGSVNPKAVAALIHFAMSRRVDLIDCHSSRDASTALAARLLGYRVVRTHHICTRLKDDPFHKLVWRYGNHRIVVTSKSIVERLVRQGICGSRNVDVIGSCIDLNRFHPHVDGQLARRTHGVPPDARVVTVVGMIRPDKGHRYLVRAADEIVSRIPNAYFLIVGSPTRPEFLEALQQEIGKVHHRERIILTGFQSAVERYIAASDVIVLTSRIEARAQVIPQAFAMKRPVVASNVGGTPELIEDGKTGFLYPMGDTGHLAERVVKVLHEDVAGVVEKAYTRAQAEFGFDRMMASTMQVYREVLEK